MLKPSNPVHQLPCYIGIQRFERELSISPIAVIGVGATVDMAPSIPVRAVGSQGFKASAQGLGCMGLTAGFYKDIDHQATEEESTAVIHRALELGVTLLDTSDIYGMLILLTVQSPSRSETIPFSCLLCYAGPFTNEELVGVLISALLFRCFAVCQFFTDT